jgi:hypothetical protein
MNKIKWIKGKDINKVRKFCKKHHELVLKGKLLSFDPASRSAGIAYYDCGILIEKGTIELDDKPIAQRLNQLYKEVSDFAIGKPDVVAIETLRGNMSHQYLMWAAGVMVGATITEHVVEIPQNLWKCCAPSDYVKSDEDDAEWVGRALIEIAKEESVK